MHGDKAVSCKSLQFHDFVCVFVKDAEIDTFVPRLRTGKSKGVKFNLKVRKTLQTERENE